MNNLEQPLVSVIIPTYKRPDNLLRAIQSVRDQTYKNIEIIIVDDNGKGTEWQIATEKELSQLIADKVITYIPHDVNRNGSAARNTGFRASHGEYINFLDDDDVFLPKKIQLQVEKLQNTEEIWGACFCNSIKKYKTRRNKIIIEESKIYIEGNICKQYLLNPQYSFNTSTILFKREAIKKLNGFDESFKRFQDVELMVRFFVYYKILNAGKEPLTLYDLTSGARPAYNDYSIREKFLHDRKEALQKQGVFEDISFLYWLYCARNQLLNLNLNIYFKAINNARSIRRISLYEYLIQTKLLVKTLIKRVLFKG